jgi:MFS family permease
MPQHFSISLSERAMWLVCVAHFFSHFYLILLAPLFPQLSQRLDVGYTELGFAITVFSLLSGFTQAPIGVMVDRYGAVPLLIAGVALQGIAFSLTGLTDSYWVFVALLGIAGIANSVYHPADYSILNQVIEPSRMGRAFSYHTASGLLGEAVAPISILLLVALIGWQWALFVCGIAGVVVAAILYANSASLSGGLGDQQESKSENPGVNWRFFLSAPLLLGMLFFVGISLFTRGVTGFGVSAMHVGQGLLLSTATGLLSVWLLAAPIGVLVGGRIADRTERSMGAHSAPGGFGHAAFVAVCLGIIAVCVISVALTRPGVIGYAIAFGIGGFCAGAVAPSRDMLIRSIAPAGQTGTVFGFVSTGFNIGGIVAPPLFGYLLDKGQASGVFMVAGMASALTILTVLGTRQASQSMLRRASR